jgi:hypothetical protein
MKKWFAAIAVAVLGTVGVIAWQTAKRPAPPSVPGTLAGPSATLGVDQFMRDVERFPGMVTVEGVVSAVAADKQMLALIDPAEWDECGSVSCARLVLPVRWDGPWPDVQARVRVEGRAQKADGKLVFVARSIAPASPAKGDAR